MKKHRVALVFLCLASPAWGATQFEDSLISLKNSADQLFAGNMAMALKINSKQLDLNQLQARAQQLANENEHLTKDVLKLQDVNPAYAKKIAQLEREAFDADTQIDQMTAEIKTSKDAIARSGEENKKLVIQMKEIGPFPQGSENTKEKLRLMKMIDESKKKQQLSYEQLSGSRIPVPVVTVEASNEKEVLSRRIKREQDEIAQISSSGVIQTSPVQAIHQDLMLQMEAQIKNLQKEHDELEVLTSQLQKKTQKIETSKDQRFEQAKLQKNLDSINIEFKKLRAELNILRQKMVAMDKRKSYLETLVRR